MYLLFHGNMSDHNIALKKHGCLPRHMDSGTYLQCFGVSLFPKIQIQRNHYELLCYSRNINRFQINYQYTIIPSDIFTDVS